GRAPARKDGGPEHRVVRRVWAQAILVLILLAGPWAVPRAGAYVTILLYHRFDEDRYPTTTTSSSQFESHLAYLKEHGYRVISLEELQRCVEGTAPLPEKAVVITIDDGFASEYERAVPVLRKYGFPFTMFVFTNAIGAKGYVTWHQLRTLPSLGGTVGCHTVSHPRLINLPDEAVHREITQSKAVLEVELKRPVSFFAYPFGQYDERVRRIARRSGFSLMLTSDPGSVGKCVERDLVPRQAVVGAEMTLADFARKLLNPPLAVDAREPAPGTLSSREIGRIRVRIKDAFQYDPHQVNVFLSETGRIQGRLDPATGVIECPGPFRLTRKTNRIIVSARRHSDGLFAMHAYLVVLPGIWPDMHYTCR
ncbi:MAG TPA: polysaccharide deacetylase family protein, partial [Deltaproteobacteria bacterium]|nr:polysaccharide deacetylase family protein [Deltaproteobacteria bacterium]